MLIDAKAILGAIAKGRTSAGTFKVQIRKISALLLASDISLFPVYVPSEHNPADGPSRGGLPGSAEKCVAEPSIPT